MSDYMVEEESSDNFCHVVERGHDFFPFGKVINRDDYIFVVTVGGRSTFHKVNAPLAKGVDRDDWMERTGWCASFGYVNLIICAMFDDDYAIT